MESLRAVNRPGNGVVFGSATPAFDEIGTKTCVNLLAKVIIISKALSLVVLDCIEAGSQTPGGSNMTGGPAGRRNALETARYIEQLARELRTIAAEADLGFLAYLLAMVEDDAAATARRISDK